MQETERCSRVVTTICDADKRNMMLALLGENNMQFLSPTMGDFLEVEIEKSASAATDADLKGK